MLVFVLGLSTFSSPEPRWLSWNPPSLFLSTSASSPLTWSFSLFCPSQPACFAPISSSNRLFCTYLQASPLCQACLCPEDAERNKMQPLTSVRELCWNSHVRLLSPLGSCQERRRQCLWSKCLNICLPASPSPHKYHFPHLRSSFIGHHRALKLPFRQFYIF